MQFLPYGKIASQPTFSSIYINAKADLRSKSPNVNEYLSHLIMNF